MAITDAPPSDASSPQPGLPPDPSSAGSKTRRREQVGWATLAALMLAVPSFSVDGRELWGLVAGAVASLGEGGESTDPSRGDLGAAPPSGDDVGLTTPPGGGVETPAPSSGGAPLPAPPSAGLDDPTPLTDQVIDAAAPDDGRTLPIDVGAAASAVERADVPAVPGHVVRELEVLAAPSVLGAKAYVGQQSAIAAARPDVPWGWLDESRPDRCVATVVVEGGEWSDVVVYAGIPAGWGAAENVPGVGELFREGAAHSQSVTLPGDAAAGAAWTATPQIHAGGITYQVGAIGIEIGGRSGDSMTVLLDGAAAACQL